MITYITMISKKICFLCIFAMNISDTLLFPVNTLVLHWLHYTDSKNILFICTLHFISSKIDFFRLKQGKYELTSFRVICLNLILDMCISSRIRILNGRTFGDYQGKFTSYQYNGHSVIDYCLVSEDFIENVLYFHVDDPILRLSDHAKVSVRLLISVQVNCLKENLDNFPMKFKWELYLQNNF